jgi:hypothetical protein
LRSISATKQCHFSAIFGYTKVINCLQILSLKNGTNTLKFVLQAFDNKHVTFEEHIRNEHNMWHYLYFIVLIKAKFLSV